MEVTSFCGRDLTCHLNTTKKYPHLRLPGRTQPTLKVYFNCYQTVRKMHRTGWKCTGTCTCICINLDGPGSRPIKIKAHVPDKPDTKTRIQNTCQSQARFGAVSAQLINPAPLISHPECWEEELTLWPSCPRVSSLHTCLRYV